MLWPVFRPCLIRTWGDRWGIERNNPLRLYLANNLMMDGKRCEKSQDRVVRAVHISDRMNSPVGPDQTARQHGLGMEQRGDPFLLNRKGPEPDHLCVPPPTEPNPSNTGTWIRPNIAPRSGRTEASRWVPHGASQLYSIHIVVPGVAGLRRLNLSSEPRSIVRF